MPLRKHTGSNGQQRGCDHNCSLLNASSEEWLLGGNCNCQSASSSAPSISTGKKMPSPHSLDPTRWLRAKVHPSSTRDSLLPQEAPQRPHSANTDESESSPHGHCHQERAEPASPARRWALPQPQHWAVANTHKCLHIHVTGPIALCPRWLLPHHMPGSAPHRESSAYPQCSSPLAMTNR